MCNGERPIGAARGKQTNTMASCQPPPFLPCENLWRVGWDGGLRGVSCWPRGAGEGRATLQFDEPGAVVIRSAKCRVQYPFHDHS